MPPLSDPVRETFVQTFHATGNASEAFRTAKPRSQKWKPAVVHTKASEMLANGEVQVRLHELQAAAAEKHEITVESLTLMLKEDRQLARDNTQSSAAVSAVMGLAKLHGLIVDKAEVAGKDGTPLVPVLNITIGSNGRR